MVKKKKNKKKIANNIYQFAVNPRNDFVFGLVSEKDLMDCP